MEGFTKLRVGTIIAVVLVSIFVLLPTILQDDADARYNQTVSGVQVPTGNTGPDLDVRLAIEEGSAEALAEALRVRLRAAAVPHDAVDITDNGQLAVVLTAGGSESAVEHALDLSHELKLYSADAALAGLVGDTPEAGPADPIAELRKSLVGTAPKGDLVSIPMGQATAGDLDLVQVTLGQVELPTEGYVLVSLDDQVVAVSAVQTPEGQTPYILWSAGDNRDGILEGLAFEPLPGKVSIVEELEVVEDETEEVVDASGEESPIPHWVYSILPDTRMNLGLDLQGGIDLTLQVELDEAVLSKVTRDLAYLEESAAQDGIELKSFRRHRVEPRILVQTEGDLADLQSFFSKRMHAYYYFGTVEEEGAQVHVFEMKEDDIKQVHDQAVEQVLETLRKRVDETGVKEPSIVKKGGGRINVQLPGEVDLQSAIDAIGTTAVLEFRLVDEEFDQSDLTQMIAAAEDALPTDQFLNDALLNEWLWDTKRLSENRIVLWEYRDVEEEHIRDFPLPLKRDIMLTGDDINNAGVSWDRNQQPYVALEFKPQGATTFCRVTGENVNKRFAIILDDEIRSAPNIKERICGGRASIDMGGANDPLADANTLSLVLRTGSLNAPVSIGQVRQVGASLGQDAIDSGSIATVIGLVIVLAFMLIWYRTAGVVADIALIVNVLLVVALLAMFGATLTLPGFAGLALTIGMAVDANIIIYERIREELRMGQSPRKAVGTGFDKAAVAVLDANITTAIAGVVLFSYGTGPIKGFAVTLLIGIATTLFTALFVARTLMEMITRSSTAKLRI